MVVIRQGDGKRESRGTVRVREYPNGPEMTATVRPVARWWIVQWQQVKWKRVVHMLGFPITLFN